MQHEEITYYKGLSFLTMSRYYLQTAKLILEQISKGNPHIVEGDLGEEYFEITKWSDFNTSIPTLFMFYHGVEILLKGLYFLKNPNNNSIIQNKHSLLKIFKEVEQNFLNNQNLFKSLKKYIIIDDNEMPNILQEFINDNNDIKKIDDLYYFLRYPTNMTMKADIKHAKLKYRENDGVIFAQELIKTINILLLESGKIYQEYKTNN